MDSSPLSSAHRRRFVRPPKEHPGKNSVAVGERVEELGVASGAVAGLKGSEWGLVALAPAPMCWMVVAAVASGPSGRRGVGVPAAETASSARPGDAGGSSGFCAGVDGMGPDGGGGRAASP